MTQRLAEVIGARVLEHGETGFEDTLDLFNVRLGHSPDTVTQCGEAEDVAKCVERVRSAYGDNYERLRERKSRWDPDNLFRVNHNIVPGP